MAEENKNTQQGENEPESGKTFTQEEVNKIVQQRLERAKSKEPDELAKREAELNKREMNLTIREQLSSAGLPNELAGVISAQDEDEAIEKIEILKKYIESQPAHSKAEYNPVKGEVKTDPIREAMGLGKGI
ncbi:DUF4355 domain-containing protein [Eubacterium ventriosum]|jgi:hypothetical protein|uniref:DUF4355 domain-containing protein n=1 Tax=Eubacterium ventriosum TaxID=39496 RepID=A0A413T6R5_9FIRM|nr:DUF4355 domain-containing protein [Eubacterium ventriosum]